MTHKVMFPVVLLALTVGFPRGSALGADGLPPRAFARLGSYRFYHGPGIDYAVLSPDGRRVASAASYPCYFRHASEQERGVWERTIMVWDAATGECVRELRVGQ